MSGIEMDTRCSELGSGKGAATMHWRGTSKCRNATPPCARIRVVRYFPFTPTGETRSDASRGRHAGHAGLAHSQGPVAGTDAWMGNQPPHPTDVSRRLPHWTGL